MPMRRKHTAEQEPKKSRREIALTVKTTLIAILRRGTIVDTNDPDIIDACCAEQEKIAERIERTLA
jgi:hypothetical protein